MLPPSPGDLLQPHLAGGSGEKTGKNEEKHKKEHGKTQIPQEERIPLRRIKANPFNTDNQTEAAVKTY